MESIREGEEEEGDEPRRCPSPTRLDPLEKHPHEDLMKMAEVLAGGSASLLVKRARKLLFRRLRVGVEDGRVFVGKFHCLDKQGNIILYDTLEYRQIAPMSSSPSSSSNVNGSGMEQRSLGLVLIPARCRTSCFVECSLQEQLSLLSLGS